MDISDLILSTDEKLQSQLQAIQDPCKLTQNKLNFFFLFQIYICPVVKSKTTTLEPKVIEIPTKQPQESKCDDEPCKFC